jgi:hypothetical protein
MRSLLFMFLFFVGFLILFFKFLKKGMIRLVRTDRGGMSRVDWSGFRVAASGWEGEWFGGQDKVKGGWEDVGCDKWAVCTQYSVHYVLFTFFGATVCGADWLVSGQLSNTVWLNFVSGERRWVAVGGLRYALEMEMRFCKNVSGQENG